jgi:hypothetical protein
VAQLPLLKRLLDENLRRFRAFRKEAEANGRRHREALDEARMPHTHEYMRAFLSIKAPETVALMEEYLRPTNVLNVVGAIASLVKLPASMWSRKLYTAGNRAAAANSATRRLSWKSTWHLLV